MWVRLHYVYPYPHVDDVIADERRPGRGGLLPYLDVPFQHASPRILKLMKRPANAEGTLRRIEAWRAACPDLVVRSTFIVGFPGETEREFEELLAFLEAAQLDRVGCFAYSPVDGAAANALPDPVPDDVKEERRARFMARAGDDQRRAARTPRRRDDARCWSTRVEGRGRDAIASRAAPPTRRRSMASCDIAAAASLPSGAFARVRVTGERRARPDCGASRNIGSDSSYARTRAPAVSTRYRRSDPYSRAGSSTPKIAREVGEDLAERRRQCARVLLRRVADSGTLLPILLRPERRRRIRRATGST